MNHCKALDFTSIKIIQGMYRDGKLVKGNVSCAVIVSYYVTLPSKMYYVMCVSVPSLHRESTTL